MKNLFKIFILLLLIPNFISAQFVANDNTKLDNTNIQEVVQDDVVAPIFTFSGEFRPRTEYHHGYKSLATKDQDAKIFTNQRTRLNFGYKTAGYNVFISLQDVRVWGTIPQLKPNVGVAGGVGTYLHQAYAEMNLMDGLALKAGRQEIFYDDHRIFGHVGWAPQARSHDAFVFKYNKGFKADLGLSFNINANPASYTAFQYLWLHKDFSMLKTSLLFLNNGKTHGDPTGDKKDKIVYTQTIGTRTGIKTGGLSAFVNFYLQMGAQGFTEKKVNASLLGIDLGYKINKNFSIGLGYELQSGNDMVNPNDENNAFSPFYGTNHKFNGHMDYFYVGNHFNSVGLQDIFGSLKYKAGKLSTAAVVHLFSAAEEFKKDKSQSLGTEIDLSIGYPIAKGVGFKVGYSHMLGTESLQILKRSGDFEETSNWGWMMFVIKPTFFSTK